MEFRQLWGGEGRDGVIMPEAPCSNGLPFPCHGHSIVDKVLYQNLLEIIPLLELFMNQQWSQNNTFSHHASLVYTPAPFRCSLRKADEHPVQAKSVGRLFHNVRGGPKDGTSADCIKGPTCHTFEELLQDVLIIAATFPSDRAGENAGRKDGFLVLQSRIEQLEKKLEEKESELQSAEISVKRDLIQLQMKVEELRREIWDKDQRIQDACKQLSGKEEENSRLLHRLERAESDVLKLDRKAATAEAELNNLRCQMAAFILQIECSKARDANAHPPLSADALDGSSLSSQAHVTEDGRGDSEEEAPCRPYETGEAESARRRYFASVIVAREAPSEELLVLVSEFRVQLQSLLAEHSFSAGSEDLFSD